jgi:hypothetical protein
MALCVMIHATGITSAMRWDGAKRTLEAFGARRGCSFTLAGWIILLHLIEITVWAAFYAWNYTLPPFIRPLLHRFHPTRLVGPSKN